MYMHVSETYGLIVSTTCEKSTQIRGDIIPVTTRKSRDVGLTSRQRVKARAEASIDSTQISLDFTLLSMIKLTIGLTL